MIYIKTYESFDDDSDTMARYQLFNNDTTMSFYFNNEHITDPDGIKDLIQKYNQYYIEGGSWTGGPPPTKFVEYFNEKYSNKGDATRKTWYPVVALLIETPDYGSIIIGFSIINKKFKLYNWQGLKNPDTNDRYNYKVLDELNSFIKREIDKKSLTVDGTIELLNLNVKNKIEWEWQE